MAKKSKRNVFIRITQIDVNCDGFGSNDYFYGKIDRIWRWQVISTLYRDLPMIAGEVAAIDRASVSIVMIDKLYKGFNVRIVP